MNGPINIFSWNAQSLNSREKQLYVTSLTQEYDVICLQETWAISSDNLVFSGLDSNFCLTQRTNERGGGSLTILNNDLKIVKTFAVNKDSSLLKLVIHQNKVLWLCNVYFNRGSAQQIRKIFKTIRDEVPKDEWNRIVLIGDLNINLCNLSDERVRLLQALAKEFKLELLKPESPTRREAKLDFALVSRELKGCLEVENPSL